MSKTFDIAVTYGRFNLLHKGHMRLFERMDKNASKLYIGLSSAQRNLPAHMRSEAIKAALNEYGIKAAIVDAGNPFELFQAVNLPDAKIITIFGTDQYTLANAANKAYGWSQDLVERLTSSTAIRAHIDNEEWDILADLVPASIIPHVINLRQIENATLHIDQAS